MLTHAAFSGFTSQQPPYCFEAGTPNTAGVLGFSAALDWLQQWDRQAAEAYSCSLANAAEQRLSNISGFRSFRASAASVLAFDFADLHHHDVIALLAEQQIALRAGQHCAQPLTTALGVAGTLRASFAPYNTQHEVDLLCAAIERSVLLLRDDG